MDFEEFADRYKHTSVALRFAILTMLAVIYPANMYLSDGEILNEDLGNAQSSYQTALSRLTSAQGKVAELPPGAAMSTQNP